jgi:hypothetical protein
MMRWLLVTALCAGCGSGPSEEQCKQLLDHLVDLEFKKAGATATADSQKADLAKQKERVIEAKTDDFIVACKQRTARARVECALAANDLETVAKCDNEGQSE